VVALGGPGSGRIDKQPVGQEKGGRWRDEEESFGGKATILIIIHIGGIGYVQ
jgi:hypothetical protein